MRFSHNLFKLHLLRASFDKTRTITSIHIDTCMEPDVENCIKQICALSSQGLQINQQLEVYRFT